MLNGNTFSVAPSITNEEPKIDVQLLFLKFQAVLSAIILVSLLGIFVQVSNVF